MASYEITVWVHRATDEPEIVTTIEVGSAAEAMVRVLRSRGLPGATQVEVSMAGGLVCWR